MHGLIREPMLEGFVRLAVLLLHMFGAFVYMLLSHILSKVCIFF